MPYSFAPVAGLLTRLARRRPSFASAAVERWEIAPAERLLRRPATLLSGQLERIRNTEFASPQEVVTVFRGLEDPSVPATRAMRFRDVDLHDGVLYAGGAEFHLRPRSAFRPIFRRPEGEISGAIYDSWPGNRWFGNWIMDDCLTYMLAAAEGTPLTTALQGTGHMSRYEALLGMKPLRVSSTRIRELVMFEDQGNNSNKAARAEDMRNRLLQGRPVKPVTGVFLLRGTQGAKRLLSNEMEIAERLEAEYGFHVLDPMQTDMDAIIEACAGAEIVVGVEGSQLVHGLAVMPRGAALLTLQPPDRVTVVLKLMTDRRDQRFAAVIGEGGTDDFRIAWEEVRRTLDLLL